ncbi:MAG: NADP-reducing hydrogenase subunit HndD [Candidatus Marinimicrobia bacterium]|jgi:iron-only hydrogenase group A|nr:NADP-reducing hydrogenase subunit HndD [Candidatus Neomarinimicrobiota bacterium]
MSENKQKLISVTIDGTPVAVPENTTILDAAKLLGVYIPTLCHHEDLCVAGNCRVCMVEVKGSRTLQASCATPVSDGMEIYTNSRLVRTARKHVIELLLSEHRGDCLRCYRNGNCELQALANEYRIDQGVFIDLHKEDQVDISSPAIQKDDSKCIRCQRCVRACTELQSVSALCVAHKGADMRITTFWDKALAYVVCTNCGQCVAHCPTGALTERNYVEDVWDAIYDPTKHVVVQTAPAIRVSIGEEVGLEPGQRVTKQLVTALRRLGFDSVLDTDFTADLTIIEEGNELLHRLTKAIRDKEDVALPMITSCSPGWIKYIEHEFSNHLDHLSTCKSPQQMFGPLAKTYYAEKIGVDPKDMVVVSIMPCTAKKFEAARPEMMASGLRDVDYVLTTRELGLMIRQAGIDFTKLEEGDYDSILGKSTGAGAIFGVTGGVMEAALRTAYELITGREIPFPNLDIKPVRGLKGVKEATLKIEGTLEKYKFLEGVELKVAIGHGLTNARKIMKQLESGESPYHFIEIMACPGGCIGGGGQPIPTTNEIRMKRSNAIYDEDEKMQYRKSHENPEIIGIYEDFLKEPLGHKSHELLHTTYVKREKN